MYVTFQNGETFCVCSECAMILSEGEGVTIKRKDHVVSSF